MSGSGRPLRFLIAVTTLWVGMRAAWLWPDEVPVPAAAAAAPQRLVAAAPPAGIRIETATEAVPTIAQQGAPFEQTGRSSSEEEVSTGRVPNRSDLAMVAASGRSAIGTAPLAPVTPAIAPERALPDGSASSTVQIAAAPLTISPAASRLSGSAWLIARGGSAAPLVPQLGGSQAGLRLTYAIDTARRLSLAGRISGALDTVQREAAVGLDWRPTGLPVHILAEQRIGLGGIRGGPALGVVGGIGPTAIAGKLELDAYAQAGAIARRGGFADGAVRIAHPVAVLGEARLHLGAGAWGAAQREARRLDLGPVATLAAPVAGRTLRFTLDWRQRIAGNAAPASGPALSVGTDF